MRHTYFSSVFHENRMLFFAKETPAKSAEGASTQDVLDTLERMATSDIGPALKQAVQIYVNRMQQQTQGMDAWMRNGLKNVLAYSDEIEEGSAMQALRNDRLKSRTVSEKEAKLMEDMDGKFNLAFIIQLAGRLGIFVSDAAIQSAVKRTEQVKYETFVGNGMNTKYIEDLFRRTDYQYSGGTLIGGKEGSWFLHWDKAERAAIVLKEENGTGLAILVPIQGVAYDFDNAKKFTSLPELEAALRKMRKQDVK